MIRREAADFKAAMLEEWCKLLLLMHATYELFIRYPSWFSFNDQFIYALLDSLSAIDVCICYEKEFMNSLAGDLYKKHVEGRRIHKVHDVCQ